jgi:hypothetical protein
MAASMVMTLFRNVAPHTLAKIDRRFKNASAIIALKTKAESIAIYNVSKLLQTTRRNIPEDSQLG